MKKHLTGLGLCFVFFSNKIICFISGPLIISTLVVGLSLIPTESFWAVGLDLGLCPCSIKSRVDVSYPPEASGASAACVYSPHALSSQYVGLIITVQCKYEEWVWMKTDMRAARQQACFICSPTTYLRILTLEVWKHYTCSQNRTQVQ